MFADDNLSPPLSPTDTLVDGKSPSKLSPIRRYVLLIIFCLAAFLDALNSNSMYSAIPSLVLSLGITESESTWVVSAFQLTFASFLLVVSRPSIAVLSHLIYLFSYRVEGLAMYIIRVGYLFYFMWRMQVLNSSI